MCTTVRNVAVISVKPEKYAIFRQKQASKVLQMNAELIFDSLEEERMRQVYSLTSPNILTLCSVRYCFAS